MYESAPFATWDVLRDLGFKLDADVISDFMPGLSFDFGNFKLKAGSMMNLKFQNVVILSGILQTNRSIAEVEFEMPLRIESRELCAAWIVWHLDKSSRPDLFVSTKPATWLELGRQHRDQLPWEKQLIEWEREAELYRQRPHCRVARKWLRLALTTMGEHLKSMEDPELVTVAFNDGVLTLRLGSNRIVLAAEGTSWECTYSLPAGNLRVLPKRLMGDPVVVGIWHSQLEIDRNRYDGLISGTDSVAHCPFPLSIPVSPPGDG